MRCTCFSSSESNSLLINSQLLYKDRTISWVDDFFRWLLFIVINTELNIRSLEYICWCAVWFTRCFPCVFFFMTSSARFFTRITPFFLGHISFSCISPFKKKRKDISFHFFFVLRENGGENTPRRRDNNVEEKKPSPQRFEDDGSANYNNNNNRQRR